MPGVPQTVERHARWKYFCVSLALALAALGAYSNHFQNGFHFDDIHTILDNVYIEHLQHVPRFFTDATLFSSRPEGRTWRPMVSTSLALDFWLGRGRSIFTFHLSTFLWFVVLLVLMFLLFRRLMDAVDPHPSNIWAAGLAAAVYGLHPACAETVNYIIQRGDVFDTVGVAGSLLWFAARPQQRKYGLYMLPALAAYLSKAPALVYPFILWAYVWLFERKWGFPKIAFGVTAAAAALTAAMTPSTYHGGALSGAMYRLTQPWVALHYFKCFFLPTDLTADTDWTYVASAFSAEALAGYAFVAAMVWAAIRMSRRRQLRPIAFGVAWFLLAMLPTSLMPLADVTNDHRMFFPFVGLALAAVWGARLLLFGQTDRLTANRRWIHVALAAAAALLLAAGLGVRARNRVWHDEESLWQDVTVKSPKNSRGWMNYGNVFLGRSDFARALPLYQRAEALYESYPPLQVNLGITYGGLGRDEEAERHFNRALALARSSEEPYIHYARWMQKHGRLGEAEALLEEALKVNRLSFNARDLLSQVYFQQGKQAAVNKLLEETVTLAFDEQTAQRYMAERARRMQAAADGQAAGQAAAPAATPDTLVNMAAQFWKEGKYPECLAAAKKAADLRPGFPEAYNNMAAALLSMQRWDEGIAAARKALELKPDYQDAKNNLTWALANRPGARPGER
jgi:protein O-mannosyl-transferase